MSVTVQVFFGDCATLVLGQLVRLQLIASSYFDRDAPDQRQLIVVVVVVVIILLILILTFLDLTYSLCGVFKMLRDLGIIFVTRRCFPRGFFVVSFHC